MLFIPLLHSVCFKQKLDLLTFQSCPRLLHTGFPLMLSFDEIHPPTYPHPLSQLVTSPCLCHHRNHLYETEKCKKNLNFFCIFCPWQAEPAVAATATVAMIIASTHAGAGVKNLKQGIPCGLGGERWTCEPRVSGSIP